MRDSLFFCGHLFLFAQILHLGLCDAKLLLVFLDLAKGGIVVPAFFLKFRHSVIDFRLHRLFNVAGPHSAFDQLPVHGFEFELHGTAPSQTLLGLLRFPPLLLQQLFEVLYALLICLHLRLESVLPRLLEPRRGLRRLGSIFSDLRYLFP